MAVETTTNVETQTFCGDSKGSTVGCDGLVEEVGVGKGVGGMGVCAMGVGGMGVCAMGVGGMGVCAMGVGGVRVCEQRGWRDVKRGVMFKRGFEGGLRRGRVEGVMGEIWVRMGGWRMVVGGGPFGGKEAGGLVSFAESCLALHHL